MTLVGKWVSVTGVIASFGNKPQAIVDFASQIQVLGSETIANQRLNFNPIPNIEPSIVPLATSLVKKPLDKEVDVFNDLYKDKPISAPPKTSAPAPVTQPKPYIPPAKISSPIIPTVNSSNQTNYKASNSTSTKVNRGGGCIVPIVFTILGTLILGAASDGKMWFLGAVAGGLLGVGFNKLFTS